MTDMEEGLKRELGRERQRACELEAEREMLRSEVRAMKGKLAGRETTVQPVWRDDGDEGASCSGCWGDLDRRHVFCPGCGKYVDWESPALPEEDDSAYDRWVDAQLEEKWSAPGRAGDAS